MLHFISQNESDMSAPKLINSLMNVPAHNKLSISQLLAAGQLFDIEASAVRMAVARMTKNGLIMSPKRGVYATGPKARALKSEISKWRDSNKKTKAWNGQWIIAHSTHLGRSNKTALRIRERALRLYGFAESQSGLWVRPANLKGSLDDLQQALTSLGLEPEVILIQSKHVLANQSEAWKALWSAKDLLKSCKTALSVLQNSKKKLSKLSTQEAACETLLVGQSVIRTINLDPQLPTEICDIALFEKLLTAMKDYDDLGRVYWRKFFASYKKCNIA